jgi:hypothetical protein
MLAAGAKLEPKLPETIARRGVLLGQLTKLTKIMTSLLHKYDKLVAAINYI